MAVTKEVTQAQDFGGNVDWIMDAYESRGASFPAGFQKDSIQNAAGARISDSWDNWRYDLKIETVNNRKLLIVEDSGATGLTGPNLNQDKIQELIDSKELNDKPEWRLARFSSRNVSGGNIYGAGKFGVGKTVYSAASESYSYWFESVRCNDHDYVANYNKRGKINYEAWEGEEAKNKIIEETGLQPKTTTGTRIIILDPNAELLQSIENHEIEKFIQESWWISLPKMVGNSGIYVNNKKIELPILAMDEHSFELSTPQKVEDGRVVKHFSLHIAKNENSIPWKGIAFFRVGMKIGEITVDEIPSKMRNRVYGYVEVDKPWETELSEIEDPFHYGLQPRKTSAPTFKALKGFVSQATEEKLKEWGYIKDSQATTKRINDMIQKVSEKAFSIAETLGFDDLGKGERKKIIDDRWKEIEYPNDSSREVTIGDIFKAKFRINNNSAIDRKIHYSITLISENNDVKEITSDDFTVQSKSYIDTPFNFEFNKDNAFRYEKNSICLTVSSSGLKDIKKVLDTYFDTKEPENHMDGVSLALSIDYPNTATKRINTGEKLSNIVYTIYNHRAQQLDYRLSVSIKLPPKKGKKGSPVTIKSIGTKDGTVGAEDQNDIVIDDIIFDQEYEQYLKHGELLLCAKVVSTNGDHGFAKGERICPYDIVLYFNVDEKSGLNNSFTPLSENRPEIHNRSWAKLVGNSREIVINTGHPAFKRIQDDDDLLEDYLSQEILRQFVLLYLKNGNFKMFTIDPEKDSPEQIVGNVLSKMEDAYYQSFQEMES